MGTFNIDILSSLVKVSQVSLIFILIFLSFKSIKILGKRELFWVALGFCFNLIYILFGILADKSFEIIRSISPGTKYLFHATSVLADLTCTLCFLLAFSSWYYFTYTLNPGKGIFKSAKLMIVEGKRTFLFTSISIIAFSAVIASCYIFDFNKNLIVYNFITCIYDAAGIFALTFSFYKLPKLNTSRWYLIMGFGSWGILQLIVLFPPLLEKSTVELLGYSASFVSKSLILVGFFLWYIVVGNQKQREIVRQQAQLETYETSLTVFDEILRSTFHEINIPLRRLETSLEHLTEYRFLRANTAFDDAISNFERVKAIIAVSINAYKKEESHGENADLENIYLKQKIISANTLIEIAIKNIKQIYKNAEFKVSYASKCHISCSNVQIVQVLTNLIKNAVEAYDEFSTKEIFIKTSTSKERDEIGKRVIIEIEDRASGILEENINSIWESRFTTKTVDHHNAVRGNGLFIVKKIMENHQGSTLEVEFPIQRIESSGLSKIVNGTKFTLSFQKIELVKNTNK